MTYGAFLVQAILISLSGVMAPGPLTVVVVGKGAHSPRAGAMIAVGHGLVEFPLMALIVIGLAPALRNATVAASIGLAGGVVLLWMGCGLLRSLRRSEGSSQERAASPLMAGVLMSAGNPYFIVWWATVGATLVFRAWEFGVWQLVVFAVIHWSLDLVWYFVLSVASFRGTKLLGTGFLRSVSLVAGLLLLFFGVRFVVDALRGLVT
jgi:threonine/homoserine/homoserine lactone efflux protein